MVTVIRRQWGQIAAVLGRGRFKVLVRPGVCWLDGSDAIMADFLKRKRQRAMIEKSWVLDVEEKEVFKKYT